MSNLEQALQLNLFEELDSLPKEFEDYTFSEKYEKYIKRLFDKMRGDKMHRFTKKTATVILIAAILLALIIAGFAATVGRAFIIKSFSDHFEYIITDKSNPKNVSDLTVGYITEGFVLQNEINNKPEKLKSYVCNAKFITISKYDISGDMSFNNNPNTTIETLKINGLTYTYEQTANGVKIIVWNTDDYLFVIDGNITKEEMIDIALKTE